MGAIAIRQNGGLSRNDPRRLKLFTQTVGRQLRGTEIDEAIEWCEIYGANPFVKDIYFFVFDADDQDKRRVVPVLSIMLYRKIGARTKCYRPDDMAPRFAYDKDLISPANPAGIVSCELSIFMFEQNGWHRVTECLRWEERAPIKEGATTWEKTGDFYPTGHKKAGKPKYKKVAVAGSEPALDPDKKNWRTMPETMLAKCVEAAVIRKAWPEQTAGSYVDGELDMSTVIDLTATEIIEETDKKERMDRIGGPSITVQWGDHEPLVRVPVGQAADRILEFIGKNKEEPSAIAVW